MQNPTSKEFSEQEIAILKTLLDALLQGRDLKVLLRSKDFSSVYNKVLARHTSFQNRKKFRLV